MKMIMVSQVTGTDEVGSDIATPTIMNAEMARCFYPRKEDRNGTRITFDDGGGWAVMETYPELLAKFAELGIHMTELTAAHDAPAQVDEDTGEVINASDERHSPVAVQTAFIRCFYPRKDNKVGTHLTFGKHKGMAVTSLFEEVAAACGAAPRLAIAGPQS